MLFSSSGAFAVRCGQAAGDWTGQHGSYRDLVETINWSPFGGKNVARCINLRQHKKWNALKKCLILEVPFDIFLMSSLPVRGLLCRAVCR